MAMGSVLFFSYLSLVTTHVGRLMLMGTWHISSRHGATAVAAIAAAHPSCRSYLRPPVAGCHARGRRLPTRRRTREGRGGGCWQPAAPTGSGVAPAYQHQPPQWCRTHACGALASPPTPGTDPSKRTERASTKITHPVAQPLEPTRSEGSVGANALEVLPNERGGLLG